MSETIYQVDAFTDTPFRGNPAAVCILSEPKQEAWMQAVAREMNLSETAFLVPNQDGYDLRWFTPTVEVSLCGHATLASAHILYETGRLSPGQEARFKTRSGLLTAVKKDQEIILNFPATPPQEIDPPEGLADSLGVVPQYVGESIYDYLVRVGSEQEVREARPDFGKLEKIGVRGVMLTCRSETAGYDFISRFFAPGAGVDEDPVTGSAHCCLGPYWMDELGKGELMAYQASPRGGEVQVRVGAKRVHLGGKAVTVLHGELLAGGE